MNIPHQNTYLVKYFTVAFAKNVLNFIKEGQILSKNMEFNSDGSIKVPEILKDRKKVPDHIKILYLIREVPFPLGKKFLAEIIKGEHNNRIKKFKLSKLENFGALELYDYKDIYELIEKMKIRGFLQITQDRGSRYLPVLKCTKKGEKEIETGGSEEEIISTYDINEVTERDKKLFEHFGEFLNGFNDEQKKSIIEPARKILCIAGAGSGKTTVLTKRVEFLAKCRSVETSKILAITFTRKARQEMIKRISEKMPMNKVQVETFNSFSEKILQEHGDFIYDKNFRVMEFKDKIKIYKESMEKKGYSVRDALKMYYSSKKIQTFGEKKLFFDMVFQISSILESCKANNNKLSELRQKVQNLQKVSEKNKAMFVISIITEVEKLKEERGLRDYTDQIKDTIELFGGKKQLIPFYEHVLVDEYQDVNELQIRLIEKISPKNLFVVGDPRQSIYGWRGSKVEYIMNFDHKNAKIIQLTKNYRSNLNIVNSSNELVKNLGLPNIEAVKKEGNNITLIGHKKEEEQTIFVAKSIQSIGIQREEIFILARTNKQLDKMAEVLDREKIKYLKKTEEMNQDVEASEGQVTLSTVHAIKGLEAHTVYLIGVNSSMYPCLVSEDRVIEALKSTEYDKYSEELRLLYVAMTRAKENLIINYFTSLSPFINNEVKKNFNIVESAKSPSLSDRLKQWHTKKIMEKKTNIPCEKTLVNIAKKLPSNYDDLLHIQGITGDHIDNFGDEILDIINNR